MNKPFHIDEETLAKLREKLGSDEDAMSEFASRAIEEKLAREPKPVSSKKPSAYELGKHLFGKYDGERPDLSSNADEIVAQIIREKHQRHNDSR